MKNIENIIKKGILFGTILLNMNLAKAQGGKRFIEEEYFKEYNKETSRDTLRTIVSFNKNKDSLRVKSYYLEYTNGIVSHSRIYQVEDYLYDNQRKLIKKRTLIDNNKDKEREFQHWKELTLREYYYNKNNLIEREVEFNYTKKRKIVTDFKYKNKVLKSKRTKIFDERDKKYPKIKEKLKTL